ncbi:hypothetical protein ACHAWO_002758 [Cyclotella atomus]|uniref:Helicase-associated domain-containing protein n=1 Tax=Cyclotella atomus TaxID=382360 RepID=A0ABD3QM14_9STRA
MSNPVENETSPAPVVDPLSAPQASASAPPALPVPPLPIVQTQETMPKAAGMETRNGGEAEKKKMETLIRAVAAANEGKEYTQKDDKWHVMFDELKRYKEENGDCNVPWRYKTYALGSWVIMQRGAYNKKELPQYRIEQLDSIGFDWNPRGNKWTDMYEQLKAFKEVHGHCNVSKKLHPDKALGAFVNTQRRFYNEKRMSPERIKLLEDLDFCWNTKNEYWDDMYKQTKEYKEQHGDLNVPTTSPLYSWMSCQRTKYRNSNLSQERTDLLNAIGIDWGIINKEEQWQKMYQELKEFKDANGHCNVPDSYSLNVPLDRWVQHQRHMYKSGKLSDERKCLLLELGFLFEPQNDKWSMMYQKLLEYKEEHGDCDVSKNYKPDGLGSWVKANRRAFKKKKLVQDRIDRLNAAGFSFTMEGKKIKKVFPNRSALGFDGWFQKLVEYKEQVSWTLLDSDSNPFRFILTLFAYAFQHGDCRVPKAWAPDASLSNWVRNTRQQRKKGLLSQELIDRLDEIGFAWAPGAGNYKRTPKKHAPPALDEHHHDNIDYGMASPSHSFEEEPAAPDESNDAQQIDQLTVAYAPYQMVLNQTIQENERLAEINRQQAEEIARLRAELGMTTNRGWY